MADKVEEEVPLRYADHLVGNLDEEAESLAGAEVEPLGNVLAKILGPRRRVNLKGLMGYSNSSFGQNTMARTERNCKKKLGEK